MSIAMSAPVETASAPTRPGSMSSRLAKKSSARSGILLPAPPVGVDAVRRASLPELYASWHSTDPDLFLWAYQLRRDLHQVRLGLGHVLDYRHLLHEGDRRVQAGAAPRNRSLGPRWSRNCDLR
jgi:hypothetical protein